MFAIKEAQECVINEYLCASDWRRNLFDPICLPKKLHNIFSNLPRELIFNLRGRKKENRQCGLCLELIFSGEHYNQLLPSQTSFPILCEENVI